MTTRSSTTPQNKVEFDIINQDSNDPNKTSRISVNIIQGTSLLPPLDVSHKPDTVQRTRQYEHPVQHVKKNSKKFICQYCNSEFTRKDNLDKHQNKDCKSINKKSLLNLNQLTQSNSSTPSGATISPTDTDTDAKMNNLAKIFVKMLKQENQALHSAPIEREISPSQLKNNLSNQGKEFISKNFQCSRCLKSFCSSQRLKSHFERKIQCQPAIGRTDFPNTCSDLPAKLPHDTLFDDVVKALQEQGLQKGNEIPFIIDVSKRVGEMLTEKD